MSDDTIEEKKKRLFLIAMDALIMKYGRKAIDKVVVLDAIDKAFANDDKNKKNKKQ